MENITATLENWKLDYSFVSGCYFLSGNIHNDIKSRYQDNQWIRTSKVLEINFTESAAKTKNSIYKLGKILIQK